MRNLNPHNEIGRICAFIRDYLENSGFEKVILGLSGGIDSSVSAALAARAIGAENVIGVMMPYRNSHPDSLDDATELAILLHIEHHVVSISSMTDAYFAGFEPEATLLRRGNWMARMRMCVLYDLSAKYKALVVGTSNRTELLVGYFTQHGDAACAIEPLGHLYKSEVWQLARELNIPGKIIEKTPSADLWEGQTDEAEIGLRYNELDRILFDLTELDINFRA
ncbi:MAG: NAD+ synthase, partial [Candidatus Cloacimonadaceae bacterium]|nr:NAD+ synthase [Candidatus Cloacimonadaceae bacterium]